MQVKQKKKLRIDAKIFETTQEPQIIQAQPIKNEQNIKEDFWFMNEKQSVHFKDRDITYLFALLLNETRDSMLEMKDVYTDHEDYLYHIVPLFINETLAYVKSVAEDATKKYIHQIKNGPLPLRYKIRINNKSTILGKCLVIDAIEGDFDQEKGHTWKKMNFNEYLEFSNAKSFVVQIMVRQKIGNLSLLGIIFQNQIYLPWNKRVVNAFKIPNLYLDQKLYKDLIDNYKELPYPNFSELFPYEFFIHAYPIYHPATYLKEVKALLTINNSKYLKFIINPLLDGPVSKAAETFGQNLIQIANSAFKHPNIKDVYNQKQKEAILQSVDYSKPITLINGPPGTGKTFTSLGIISVVLQQQNKQGVILCCGHSNTVINDWVRKLTTSLIDEFGNPIEEKVVRVGNADKCDPDIYDNCLEILAQRELFEKTAIESDKQIARSLLPGDDTLTLVHMKQKISQLNDQIYDLQDFQDQTDDPDKQMEIQDKLNIMNQWKKELRRLYSIFSQLTISQKDLYRQLQSKHMEGAKIIVTTLTSSATMKFETFMEDKQITMLIVDEAPMCFEPSTLIPLSKYDVYKLVLIGDHKQLGPVIYDTTNASTYNYCRSLYDRLMVKLPLIQLNTQYRSMPKLSIVTSQFFYQNKIHDDQSVKKMEFPHYLENLSKDKNFAFFDVVGGEQQYHKEQNSYYNDLEAWGVTLLVSFLISGGCDKSKVISVITPYRAQVKRIKQTIFVYNENLLEFVDVDTVDAFQGKENDIMIISLVRSEGLGFLTDRRRANVATSRAQYGQFIFGNSKAFITQELWGSLYQYIHQNGCAFKYGQQQIAEYEQFFYNTISNS